jgi:hypothetical protein
MKAELDMALVTLGYKGALLDLQNWVKVNAANYDVRTLRALTAEIGRLNEARAKQERAA